MMETGAPHTFTNATTLTKAASPPANLQGKAVTNASLSFGRMISPLAGGPFQFPATRPGSTVLGLEEAHRDLRISPAEFDEVAAELARTLDSFNVPEREKEEVLGAFAAHKDEVTEGYMDAASG
jgi:hypothetical protein